MNRRVWFLGAQTLGEKLLGPGVRLAEMVRATADAGHEVRVVVESPRSNPFPEGIVARDWTGFSLDEIRPGDAVVANAYVSFPRLWKLLRSSIPFHLDLYCTTATEMLPQWDAANDPAASKSLRKRRLRYVLAASRAETTYVSCREQALVLSGMFLSEPGWARARLANRAIPSSLEVPMGVRGDTFPTGSANPYPRDLQGRPIFLWGGNLWSWMDLGTLAEAFGILARRGDPAVLFLLAGRNRSGRPDQDAPALELEERCRALGILGTSVVFNETSVDPSGLAPWLEHCRAGVMCNPDTLESLASWRTRYLDLLWAGKPLVVSGRDPLGDRMLAAGAALNAPSARPEALADAISRLSGEPSLAGAMGDASGELGRNLSWARTLDPMLRAFADPKAFATTGPMPRWSDLARYFRP